MHKLKNYKINNCSSYGIHCTENMSESFNYQILWSFDVHRNYYESCEMKHELTQWKCFCFFVFFL